MMNEKFMTSDHFPLLIFATACPLRLKLNATYHMNEKYNHMLNYADLCICMMFSQYCKVANQTEINPALW